MSDARELKDLLSTVVSMLSAGGPPEEGLISRLQAGVDAAERLVVMESEVLTDEHTGLGNARHLRVSLDREVARAERFRRTVSLLFADVDRFKALNDRHGHLMGSRVLHELGSRLAGAVRRTDMAFRYGGDEFAVVLVETAKPGAERVAQRILQRLRARPFLADRGLAERVTASIGVACFPDDAKSAQALLHAADMAMYRAKQAGGDQVSM